MLGPSGAGVNKGRLRGLGGESSPRPRRQLMPEKQTGAWPTKVDHAPRCKSEKCVSGYRQQGVHGVQHLAARLALHFSIRRAKKPFLGGQQGSQGSQHGSGSQQTGAGSQQTGAGSQQTGSGSQQGAGAGSQQGASTTAGSQQGSGAGSQQTGSGSQQVGSGSQQVGSGSQQVGSGQHFFFFKQPNRPASAEGVAAATTATTASKQKARTKVILVSSRGKIAAQGPPNGTREARIVRLSETLEGGNSSMSKGC